MSEQLGLEGIPQAREAAPPIWPTWFKPGKCTPMTFLERVMAGRHPFGAKLGPENKTCGKCRRAYKRGRFWKCHLVQVTNGLGTDLRKRWRCCQYFKPADTDPG